MNTRVRLAICNLQSGIGTTRGYWQYLTTAWKYGFPHDSRPIERAADFLREEDIDLAALSEIEGGSRRSRGTDQLELLAYRSDLPYQAFFPTLVLARRVNQGNAACSRWPLTHINNHPLPGVGEPRFLSEAHVHIDQHKFRLFITHLSLERPVRAPQIRHIAQHIGQEDIPTILAGDFNVKEDAELALLEDTILKKAASAPTFPSWAPKKALDHLFFSNHFELVHHYAFDGYLFSDHLPLVAEFRLLTDS